MKFTFISIFIVMLASFTGCQKDSKKVVIGFFGALTGPEATFGISSRDGITLAIEEINKNGGLFDKTVELKFYDTLGTTEEARASVEKLITLDQVVAILGEVASTRSLAGAPIAQKHKIPMISPSSTNPLVTQKGNYIFRVCFIDPFQGEVMAKFAYKSLKLRKAAILRDTQSDYSMGLADYFIKTFQGLGGSIVADENYIAGDVEFQSQLSKVKEKNPEFIFIPGYYAEAALISRQAREMGIKVPFMGGDGWDSDSLVDIAGDSVNGSYFSNHYTQEDPRPEVQSFIKRYETRFGSKPDSQAASGYDAARILFEAINRAKSTQGMAIRDALAETKNFRGVTGVISINENRDAIKSAVVLQVKGQKFKFVESIEP